VAGVAVAITVAMLLGGFVGAASATGPRGAVSPVLAINQGPAVITRQSALTVSLELASTANVVQVYFTFCQLTNSLCYTPQPMSENGTTGWYSGQTGIMMSYHNPNNSLVTVGETLGYNITIQYANNTNLTEPTDPNPFGNLKTALSITNVLEFEVVVSNQVYTVSGRVTNATTGSPVAGATVSLLNANQSSTLTNSAGMYTFKNVPNGSYTVSVTGTGYRTSNESVSVSGQNQTRDVTLSSNAAPPPPPTQTTSNPLLGTEGIGLAVVAVLVVVAVVALLMSRKRRGGATPPAEGPTRSTEPPTGKGD
jgi:hypothetical protein